jgi:MFS transporter, DHA3 family, multidrug efflux protein
MVSGSFLITTAASGIWFGSVVDQHRKKIMMQASAVASLAFYAVGFALYQLTPEQTSPNHRA